MSWVTFILLILSKVRLSPLALSLKSGHVLLIDESQNLNHARKGHHTHVLVCMGVP